MYGDYMVLGYAMIMHPHILTYIVARILLDNGAFIPRYLAQLINSEYHTDLRQSVKRLLLRHECLDQVNNDWNLICSHFQKRQYYEISSILRKG
ncbi:hypothetical protein BC936DRAFT_139544 [Jimgerdemannia flammicorona]|uniref:Uncharacterized protein n=1 Tax=Jimgerdemannia flammicorona TaxID=994334 RepID=A0A433B9P9_9FUNG|nr:hypothetical protein BC936DRAFT_139544 [Jimgerdemannia flammicorona]